MGLVKIAVAVVGVVVVVGLVVVVVLVVVLVVVAKIWKKDISTGGKRKLKLIVIVAIKHMLIIAHIIQ